MPLLLSCTLWGPRPRANSEPTPALGALATGCMLGNSSGRRTVRVTKAPPGLLPAGFAAWLLASPHPRLVGVGDDF